MRSQIRIVGAALALVAAGLSQAAWAEESVGESIYQNCKNCHGAAGEGGHGGEYPRLAGLPQAYIERQLHNFKWGKRTNKPMVPIFKNRRFNDAAIAQVAAYLTQLPEPSVPPFQPSAKVLADFDSQEEFDELGQELFRTTCSECHGEDGRGRADKETPPLVNQYPVYIQKQIGDFVAGRREHEHAAKMFGELYEEEVESLLVQLGRLSKGGGGD